MTIVCNNCGSLVQDDQIFCGACGAPNPLAAGQGNSSPPTQITQISSYLPQSASPAPTAKGGKKIVIAVVSSSILFATLAGGVVAWLMSKRGGEQVRIQATSEEAPTRGEAVSKEATASNSLNSANRSAPPETRRTEQRQEQYIAEGEVRQFLEGWKEAWESSNLQLYASYYDDDFIGRNYSTQKGYRSMTRAEWLRDKGGKFNQSNYVSITLGPASISYEGENVVVSFSQTYRSNRYSDYGSKSLRLRRNSSGEIKIIREDFVPGGM